MPNGVVTERRNEFVTALRGDEPGLHFVSRAYNTYGIWHNSSGDFQLFHSVPTDGEGWELVRWKNNQAHVSYDGTWEFPETADEIGILRMRLDGEQPTNLDAVVVGDGWIELRMPWSLLQFTDPTRRHVLDDDRNTQGRETAVSDGIALTALLGDQRVTTERLRWETWDDAPPTSERQKPSLEIFADGVRLLPHLLPSENMEDRPVVPEFWE